jgi:serine protease Do
MRGTTGVRTWTGAKWWFLLVSVVCLGIPSCAQASDTGLTALRQQGKAFAELASKAKPAVVFIQVKKTVAAAAPSMPFKFNDPLSPFNDDFFERFFRHRMPNRPQPQQPEGRRQQFHQMGQGSGFIVTSDGYILSNNHVVGDADHIRVKLTDGREFDAKLVGTDPQTDVAVIKIDAKHLPTLPLGNSDKLEVGDWVMAIGNPFGLASTVTVGVVSAKGRSSVGIVDYEDFIQTDAAINPGNSGGPLINLSGEAVGINSAIFSKSGGYMGIGFAIPMAIAQKVYKELAAGHTITRGHLGVMIQSLTPDLAKGFGLKNGDRGVLISEVTPNSPAEKAGLKTGDIIVELNGHPVKEVGQLRNAVALAAPGTKVNLLVIRNGSRKAITVTLGKLDSGKVARVGAGGTGSKLGLTVQNLTPDLARQFGYKDRTGVVVTHVAPASPAASAGIAPGTLIAQVGQHPVHTVAEFQKQVAAAMENGSVLLLVEQEGHARFVVLRVEKEQ